MSSDKYTDKRQSAQISTEQVERLLSDWNAEDDGPGRCHKRLDCYERHTPSGTSAECPNKDDHNWVLSVYPNGETYRFESHCNKWPCLRFQRWHLRQYLHALEHHFKQGDRVYDSPVGAADMGDDDVSEIRRRISNSRARYVDDTSRVTIHQKGGSFAMFSREDFTPKREAYGDPPNRTTARTPKEAAQRLSEVLKVGGLDVGKDASRPVISAGDWELPSRYRREKAANEAGEFGEVKLLHRAVDKAVRYAGGPFDLAEMYEMPEAHREMLKGRISDIVTYLAVKVKGTEDNKGMAERIDRVRNKFGKSRARQLQDKWMKKVIRDAVMAAREFTVGM